jgi:hypothetical protein
MATKADLRTQALKKMALVSEGQNPTAYQAETVDDVIDQEQALLESEGIAYWSLTDIPDGAMSGFVDLIAGRAAPRLLSAERSSPYTGLVNIGRRNLIRFTAYHGPNAPVKADYF